MSRTELASSIASPFLGTVHIYGTGFQPGARLELSSAQTGQTQTFLLGYRSPIELAWMLAYPQPGTYQAVIVNADNQRSARGRAGG